MAAGNENEIKPDVRYRLLPPEGGWGYLIVIATTVMIVTTIVPMAAFGLLFGDFLKSIDNETIGTTVTNGMFNTVLSFTGLGANFLLLKYSYRKVAFLGALIFFSGAVGIIFVKNLFQLLIFFGVIQGIGLGLMMPASFTAFNCYFDKKLTLMMSISQAVAVALQMGFPSVAALMMNSCGFRGTQAIIAAVALLNFPAAAVLQPVKRHLRKVAMLSNSSIISMTYSPEKSKSLGDDMLQTQQEPLIINNQKEILTSQNGINKLLENVILSKPRASIISLGDKAISVTATNDFERESDKRTIWESIKNSMDLSLLKDLIYLNISIGLSLSFTADVAFIAIIPLILTNIGFDTSDIAMMITAYFGMDLVARVMFSVVSAFFPISNRLAFLWGTILSAAVRMAFVMNDGYVWKMITLGAMGFLRCFIQTPLSLVISEEYNDNFATAFSLYMVVNGFTSLICGPLMSLVKSLTNSDVMVCHLLTACYVICGISWTVEMTCFSKKRKNSKK